MTTRVIVYGNMQETTLREIDPRTKDVIREIMVKPGEMNEMYIHQGLSIEVFEKPSA